MNRPIFRALWLGSLPLTLAACGGSGSEWLSGIEGSGVSQPVATAVTSAGAVTSLGSIFVNGVEFELTGASISIDGRTAAESDLDVGAIVVVEGTLDQSGATGTAARVTAGIALAGPISAIDLAQNRFTVLGQIVEIDPVTNIEGFASGEPLGGLTPGYDVEVTGFADSTGLLVARRVTPRAPSTPLQLTGYAADLDSTGQSFSINGQSVSYATATLEGFDARPLAGAAVRVTASTLDADGVLEADTVVFRDLRLPGDVGDIAQLQGWVTRFESETDFDVDGHPVVTTGATVFRGQIGEILGHVRLDAFVDVKGRLIANGVVEAAEIGTVNMIGLDSVISEVRLGALAGDFPVGQCGVTPETAIWIDGLHSTYEQLEPGDVATVHVFDPWIQPFDPTYAECRIVTVEHNVVGPLESKPDGSIEISVMGQRVWLRQGSEALEQASLGDTVAVSGYTTAAGDIVATGIHLASAANDYRVIGFAHNVNAMTQQFELGGLQVYYADAEVAGFAGDVPAEGDRVIVMSKLAPSAGLMRPTVVRYAAAIPRGATGQLVYMHGLITRFDSEDYFEVEGRGVTPADLQRFDDPGRCDWSKVHLDLQVWIGAAGHLPGIPPIYWLPGCPHGRLRDDRGPVHFDVSDDLEISGPVQNIDLAGRGLSVGSVPVKLHPASLLTHFAASAVPDDPGTSAPVRLEDFAPGERVWVNVNGAPIAGGGRPVASAWLGDVDLTDRPPMIPSVAPADMTVWTYVDSASEPLLTLRSDIPIRVSEATETWAYDCTNDTWEQLDAAAFWSTMASMDSKVYVIGAPSGDEIAASYIAWGDGWSTPFTACWF